MIAPTREELIRLRENMEMTREDIAEHFGVGVSTVRRWIREMKIPRPTPRRRKRHQPHLSSSGEIIAPVDDGLTLMERAKMQLGGRLTESPKKGYMLDGRPSHVRLIIAAAGLKMGGRT
jgi:DeoR/GlpR family transcriptional regulator of sugar metabolism